MFDGVLATDVRHRLLRGKASWTQPGNVQAHLQEIECGDSDRCWTTQRETVLRNDLAGVIRFARALNTTTPLSEQT